MAYLKHVILCLLPCMFLASVSSTCQWETHDSEDRNAGAVLQANFTGEPNCTDAIRIASYDDTFEDCVTLCQGKANCKLVIGKRKPLGNPQSQCVEFSAICTSLGDPCTNCPYEIHYASVCTEPTDNSGNNANNGNNPGSGSVNNGTSGNNTDDSLSDNSASSTSQGITVFAVFICVLLYIIN